MEDRLCKVVEENDRLRDEIDQNKIMVRNADAAVKTKIETFVAQLKQEHVQRLQLQRQVLDLTKLNRKIKAEAELDRRKKEHCDSCKSLRVKLKTVNEEMAVAQE